MNRMSVNSRNTVFKLVSQPVYMKTPKAYSEIGSASSQREDFYSRSGYYVKIKAEWI